MRAEGTCTLILLPPSSSVLADYTEFAAEQRWKRHVHKRVQPHQQYCTSTAHTHNQHGNLTVSRLDVTPRYLHTKH
jgi:hypothetical protein